MMQSHWFRHAVTGSITTRSGRGTGHDRLTDSRLQRIFCGPERVKWIENELALWMRRSAKLMCPRTWLFGSVAEKQGHLSESQERKQNVTRIKRNPFDGPALRLILQDWKTGISWECDSLFPVGHILTMADEIAWFESLDIVCCKRHRYQVYNDWASCNKPWYDERTLEPTQKSQNWPRSSKICQPKKGLSCGSWKAAWTDSQWESLES